MVKRLVGYVIGTAREEFLALVKRRADALLCVYVVELDAALFFRKEAAARRMVREIDKPGVAVCPLYDLGSHWGVGWSIEWGIGDEPIRP